tara:strand:- start:852 stop:1589 length:738 start_codon:yes stop_codon:yes gene_type:complete
MKWIITSVAFISFFLYIFFIKDEPQTITSSKKRERILNSNKNKNKLLIPPEKKIDLPKSKKNHKSSQKSPINKVNHGRKERIQKKINNFQLSELQAQSNPFEKYFPKNDEIKGFSLRISDQILATPEKDFDGQKDKIIMKKNGFIFFESSYSKEDVFLTSFNTDNQLIGVFLNRIHFVLSHDKEDYLKQNYANLKFIKKIDHLNLYSFKTLTKKPLELKELLTSLKNESFISDMELEILELKFKK